MYFLCVTGVFIVCQVSKGVMTYVPQEVKDLYYPLENDFHPLDLAGKVQPLLGKLSKLSHKLSPASPVPEVQLEQYIPALERLTTLRVLQQVRFSTYSLFTLFFSFLLFTILQHYNFWFVNVDKHLEFYNL